MSELVRDDSDLIRVIDADGVPVEGTTVPDIDDETLVAMYRDMRTTREFDQRAISIQRQGRLGTYASCAGHEGAQIGSTYALSADDWILYQYREHGAVVARGLDAAYLEYWMGHERGNAALADRHIFPLNISIAGHIPHAVGMSWASKLQGEERAFLAHFGDGATSEGDFHEAMNFAGTFDTPTIFFCNNNQWAISVPAARQTASETFAQKAAAYGFDGVRVDGMDPLAVYQVTREAARRAKRPDGDAPRPTLIEAVMYRFGAHTTADDPTAYRDEGEVERWREYDPLPRFESFLRRTGRLDDETVDAIGTAAEDRISELIAEAEAYDPAPKDLFADAYAALPPELQAQRDEFLAMLGEHGHGAFRRD